MSIKTGVDMDPPIGKPYRTQTDWGTISPKMTGFRVSMEEAAIEASKQKEK
jgi:hypothetical protein